MKIENHWLAAAEVIPSPNFNERPDPDDIALIVIHSISLPPQVYGGSEITDLFMNRLDCQAHPYFNGLKGLEVSAHLLIRRDGKLIQYVAFDKRAWHAGVSQFHDRDACNDFAIGIELEGCDDEGYTDHQYQQLIPVLQALYAHYPKCVANGLVGHCDIAPGRKTDPGKHFDWARLAQAGFRRVIDRD